MKVANWKTNISRTAKMEKSLSRGSRIKKKNVYLRRKIRKKEEYRFDGLNSIVFSKN